MAEHNKYSPYSLVMGSWDYLTVPVKTCISLFPKLTGRYQGLVHPYLDDPEEEIMLGYESSWAGVSDNTDNKMR